MIEDDADEQERAAAEALARALEGASGEAQAGAPEDALQTAALLRASARQAELATDRSDAIYAALGGDIERHIRPRRSRGVVWLSAGALAAAAAVLLYVASQRDDTQEQAAQHHAQTIADLPAPPAALLAAQAALGRRAVKAEDKAAFEREMRAYRANVLEKLKREYPAHIGMLERRPK